MSTHDAKSVSMSTHDAKSVSIRLGSTKMGGAIEWSAVCFAAGETNILQDTWGAIPTGSVCAVLGPSGAGKSSLLNILAGRIAPSRTNKISGEIRVDGVTIDPVAFRKRIAYVMQDDALDPTATPREALQFSCSLRTKKGRAEVDGQVDKLLEALGIKGCANTFVGGETIKGISGGERKRTSVGVEVVTEPKLLFLDEPTSGLDAYSASRLVQLLKEVARSLNATVMCSIHQPSSNVFSLFDQSIFMKDGRIVYAGDTRHLADYFAECGMPVPERHNPADHAMFIIQNKSLEELQELKLMMAPKVTFGSEKDPGKSQGATETIPAVVAPWHTQVEWLMRREGKRLYRDKAALLGRFGITFLMNILFGAIFFGAGRQSGSSPQALNDHFGALVMCAISSMFGAAQPALLTFPIERPIFLREYSSGTYSALPYFISKVMVEIPMSLVQTLVAWLVVYWMIGFQGNFILLVLASWALGSAATSVAICLGSVVPDVKQAVELTPLLFVPQLLFSGFFVRTTQIPAFLRWAQYLCSLKYALNLLVLIEFNEETCSKGGQLNQIGCDGLKEGLDIDSGLTWLYALILVLLFAFFRILGAILLRQKAKTVF